MVEYLLHECCERYGMSQRTREQFLRGPQARESLESTRFTKMAMYKTKESRLKKDENGTINHGPVNSQKSRFPKLKTYEIPLEQTTLSRLPLFPLILTISNLFSLLVEKAICGSALCPNLVCISNLFRVSSTARTHCFCSSFRARRVVWVHGLTSVKTRLNDL